MNTATTTAFYWLSQGIATLPVKFRDKVPDGRALRRAGFVDSEQESRPSWLALQKRLPTVKEIEIFFQSSIINLGVITGGARNLAVIDFDDFGAFVDWLRVNTLDTFMVRTSRGMHVYLFSEDPVTARSAPGIVDVKANGGYVLAPPSVHPCGYVYEVFNTAPILQVKSVDALLPSDWFPVMPARPVNLDPEPISRPVSLDAWESAERAGEPGRDLIASIKAAFPILSFFPEAQRHKSGGRWYMALCPLHDDHNPSLWIDPARGVCGCLAGCNGRRPMDVINLYALLHGVDVQEAISELGEKLRERGCVSG